MKQDFIVTIIPHILYLTDYYYFFVVRYGLHYTFCKQLPAAVSMCRYKVSTTQFTERPPADFNHFHFEASIHKCLAAVLNLRAGRSFMELLQRNLAAPRGFEPRNPESESGVLPIRLKGNINTSWAFHIFTALFVGYVGWRGVGWG